MQTLYATLPIDAALKALKKNQILVARCKQPIYVSPCMPDQPDPDKRVLSVRVSRELYAKLQAAAKAAQMGFNEYIRALLLTRTDHVVLTKEDYDQILAEKEQYLKNRSK